MAREALTFKTLLRVYDLVIYTLSDSLSDNLLNAVPTYIFSASIFERESWFCTDLPPVCVQFAFRLCV